MIFNREHAPIVLIRGGGDLASGAALRLHRAGFRVVITELAEPLVVRRLASFAQAIFDGFYRLEEVEGVLTTSLTESLETMAGGKVAIMVDPGLQQASLLELFALVDGRMLKSKTEAVLPDVPRVIGLGPGFTVGMNCHAVVETNRGPFLGRVYWDGSAEMDSGIPESVRGFTVERVLYSPAAGKLEANARIGDIIEKDDLICTVEGLEVRAQFKGVLRGLIHHGLTVGRKMKIGDLDPRCDSRLCTLASDKALAIGGGVLEALLALYEPETWK